MTKGKCGNEVTMELGSKDMASVHPPAVVSSTNSDGNESSGGRNGGLAPGMMMHGGTALFSYSVRNFRKGGTGQR